MKTPSSSASIRLLVCILATGCSGGVAVQTAEVRRDAIQEFVDEQGKTRLPTNYVVTMPFAGRVQDITLQEGDAVAAGQAVAHIAAKDLDLEVAEAKAAVERLEASIVENDDKSVELSSLEQSQRFVESMISTVAAAESRKTSSAGRVEFTEKDLGRVRKLADSATAARTKEDLDRAELAFIEAKVNYQQDVLVAESIKSISAATALMPKMVTDYIGRKRLSRAVLERQKSEAEARLNQALTRQQRGSMTSPVQGVVLERLITHEQFLPAGTTLMKIGDLQQLEVEADILSQDVVRIHPGDKAEIYGAAIGESGRVGGEVVRVHPAGFTKLSSLGVEQQRVKVVLKFSAGVLDKLRQAGVGVDYRVRVRIFTAAKENALVVPRSALFRGPAGDWQVFSVNGGKAQLAAVTIGLVNDDAAEITSGLEAGVPVLLSPESKLAAGARVRAVP